jgi:hypothetical protein
MATTMKDLGIDRLCVEDRLALVQEIWDSIAAEPDQIPLTDAQRSEWERLSFPNPSLSLSSPLASLAYSDTHGRGGRT